MQTGRPHVQNHVILNANSTKSDPMSSNQGVSCTEIPQTFVRARRCASSMRSTISSDTTAEMNIASNWEGARYTPA